MLSLKFKLILLSTLIILLLSNCSKKVTSRKLDGDWTVTNIEGAYVTYSSFSNSITNYTVSYNGSQLSTVSDQGDNDVSDYTIDLSFNKKDGTYTETITEITYDTSKVAYYSFDGTNYVIEDSVIRYQIHKEVTITKGNFIISGGAADIEKNSELIMTPTHYSTDDEFTFKYFKNNVPFTDLNNYYIFFNYIDFATPYKEMKNLTLSKKSSEIVKIPAGFIYRIESINKDEMVYNFELSSESQTNSYNESYKKKYTFKKK